MKEETLRVMQEVVTLWDMGRIVHNQPVASYIECERAIRALSDALTKERIELYSREGRLTTPQENP